MSVSTKLTLTDNLPLTCSRSGTCCHGKTVKLNPWELACLAEAKGQTPRAFRDRYCDFGGIQLRFDGAPGWSLTVLTIKRNFLTMRPLDSVYECKELIVYG